MTLHDQNMALRPESERLSVWPRSASRGLSLSGLTCKNRDNNFRYYSMSTWLMCHLQMPLLSYDSIASCLSAKSSSLSRMMEDDSSRAMLSMAVENGSSGLNDNAL